MNPFDLLTKTEKVVCKLRCEGLSPLKIAEKLVVTKRTVDAHLYSIYHKLNIPTQVELLKIKCKGYF